MITSIFEKIKSRKGASTVDFSYNMLLFVILIVAGYEFFMMGYKYMTVSNFANDLARTISIQGGVDVTVPNGFQGGNGVFSSYKKTRDIMNDVNDLANSINQDVSDIEIRVKYQPSGGNTFITRTLNSGSSLEIDYGDRFEIIVSYMFRMEMLDKVVNVNDSFEIERRKGGVSEFEHDYES